MKEKELASLEKQLDIDEVRIHEEIIQQPIKYLRWAIRAAKANRRFLDIQTQTKVLAAEEMKKIREKHFKDTGKELAATINLEKTHLPLNKDYRKQIATQIEAEEELDILIAAREAWKQRKDLLVTYGNMLRDEIKSDNLVIRQKGQENT
jgi:hypothetical protein